MKHVPNVREERKTGRDGTQVPMKKNSQGWDPMTHEREEHSQRQASGRGCVSVRAMGKDVSEKPMRVVKVEKLMLNSRVGESGDNLVRAEKALLWTMMRSSAHCRKQARSSGKGPSRR